MMGHSQVHLDQAQIAQLIENDHGGAPDTAWTHLANCPTCFAIFADILRTQYVHRTDPSQMSAPDYLLDMGKAIAGKSHVQEDSESSIAPSRRLFTSRKVLRGSFLVAALLLLLLLFNMVNLLNPCIDKLDQQVIMTALVNSSTSGLIFPQAGAGVVSIQPLYRNGGSGVAGDLEAVLKCIAATYSADDDGGGIHETYWLAAGWLASGQFDNARLYTEAGLRRYPDSLRLKELSAIIAYRNSDLAQAKALLLEVLAKRPNDNTVLFNLAQIYCEQNQLDDACRYMGRISETSVETVLGTRVAVLRNKLSG
ncbi:MAG: tetratricopeptide repeat protein [bacterium]|nr:tetratricopeptide repeat protein [bacterium]